MGEKEREWGLWTIVAVSSLLFATGDCACLAYLADHLLPSVIFGSTAAFTLFLALYEVTRGKLLAEEAGEEREEGEPKREEKPKVEAEPRTRKGAEIEAAEAEEPLPVRWVSGNRFARSLAKKMGEAISEYIPQIALPMSPYAFAAEHVFFLFLSLPLALAAPILALLFTPLFFFLLAVPPTLFATPWLRLKTMVGDRKREAAGELPFFAIHAALAQSAGLNMYESLKNTIGEEILKQTERGARFVRRNVQVLEMSPTAAIEELGRSHPHEPTQRLLLGYTSEWRSGGDLSSFLEDKAEQHLRLAIHQWEDYRRDVGTVAEIAITGLFVLPILVLMATFLSPATATVLGVGFVAIGIPVLLAAGFAMIRSTQPKDYTAYSGNRILPFILSPLAFFATHALAGFWVSLSVAAGVGLLAFAIPVVIEKRRTLAHEEALPQFLRDVTEYQKLNYPLPRAIRTLCKEESYNSHFNDLLNRVAAQLEVGTRPSEITVPSRSWLTRLSFFYLGQIAESGGYTAKSMELLSDFISRIKDTRDEVRSGTKIYRYIALGVPVALALIVGVMMGMFQLFAMPEFAGVKGGMGAVGGTGFLGMFQTPPVFDVIAKATIFSSSIGLGFLTSYAADFSPKDLTWPAIGAFLAGAAMHLLPMISDFFTSFFGF